MTDIIQKNVPEFNHYQYEKYIKIIEDIPDDIYKERSIFINGLKKNLRSIENSKKEVEKGK